MARLAPPPGADGRRAASDAPAGDAAQAEFSTQAAWKRALRRARTNANLATSRIHAGVEFPPPRRRHEARAPSCPTRILRVVAAFFGRSRSCPPRTARQAGAAYTTLGVSSSLPADRRKGRAEDDRPTRFLLDANGAAPALHHPGTWRDPFASIECGRSPLAAAWPAAPPFLDAKRATRSLVIRHRLVRICIHLHQYPLDPPAVRALHVLRHPVLAQHVTRDLHDDVVGLRVAVVVEAR